jgi:hypothetical protein
MPTTRRLSTFGWGAIRGISLARLSPARIVGKVDMAVPMTRACFMNFLLLISFIPAPFIIKNLHITIVD